MGLFSWISSEIEKGRQAARDEAQARQDQSEAKLSSAQYGEEIYEKRMAEAERKRARGDFEGAQLAERHANRPHVMP